MKNFDIIIAKYLDNSCSQDEQDQFHQWLQDSHENAKYFDKVKALWEMAALDAESFDPNVDIAWSQVSQRTDDTLAPSAKTKVVPMTQSWWRYAAAVVLIGMTVWVGLTVYDTLDISSKQILVETQAERNTAVILPDGSQVWLSANSSLSYPQEFSEDTRTAKLQGMAYFEVVKDSEKPFFVSTKETVTTVVGTAFNVRAIADENQVQVTVSSGKVRFASSQDRSTGVALDPGDQGVFNKSNRQVDKVTNEDLNFLSWKTGKLIFRNTPLPQVIAVVNEHYQSKVIVGEAALNSCQITSTFDNKSLEEILQVLKEIFNGEVTYRDDTISITGSGCL